MLNLSAYTASLEDHEDEIPSPLMDYNTEPAIVSPVAEFIEPIEGALPVIEEAVVLPPALDPTPLQPLPETGMQEELIAENLDAEVGQLMGAQIALEGYSKLLRGAGKNMTRQSAAFMAVGMMRANRIMGVTSLGLESEESGTQVMAMQKANVDEKGLGAKIKEIAAKIWEWIKEKGRQLRALYDKIKASFAKDKEKVVYLIAAAEAVQSGNPGKVEKLEAPSGLKTSQVLDAIHGEGVRNPTSKTVTLPGALAQYVTLDGKLDLNVKLEHDLRSNGVMAYIKDGTAFLNEITAYFSSITKDTSVEEISDNVSDIMKKTIGKTQATFPLHGGMSAVRGADGSFKITGTPVTEAIEVQSPGMPELTSFLKSIEATLDADVRDGEAVSAAYTSAIEKMMSVGDQVSAKLGAEHADKLGSALGKVLRGAAVEDNIRDLSIYMDRARNGAVAACDFFIASHLGGGNSISQEDYIALPSNQAPAGPGLGSRIVSGAKEAWAKLKAYFLRLWQQFTEWAKRLWARITGTDQKTTVLLLTNAAVPEDGQPGSGDVQSLPPGTGLKSVQAARALGGPSTTPDAGPGEPPVVVEPDTSVPSAGLPNGMVYVQEAAELMVNGTVQFDPIWEEQRTTWLVNHYIPTQEKVVRDLISFAGSYTFDGGLMGYIPTIEKLVQPLFQGMPSGPVPGQRTITQGEGCKLKVSQEGMMGEVQPIKLMKKRQIDQALARQKKLLKVLSGLEKSRLIMERQRGQLNAILDRRVQSGVTEQAVTQFYNTMEHSVMVSSASVVASVIAKMCDARVAVADAMIVARAQGKK